MFPPSTPTPLLLLFIILLFNLPSSLPFSPHTLYDFQSSLSTTLSTLTTSPTSPNVPVLIPVCYGLGLVTSLSPCTLGLLPITLTYIKSTTPRRGKIISPPPTEEDLTIPITDDGSDAEAGVATSSILTTSTRSTTSFQPTRAFSTLDTLLATVLYSAGLSFIFATLGVGLTAA
eukprot:CAMPEP_0118640196 /NCGR_PEP_ID=MMETSP0785-20121206/4624_1 /TAXON_ID=91992 /ORGANISM="Bolidomonas pacifica, Strain CCMP 1866" /LENGTH=173 /DNA_ID=CAMNT_0006531567 /DNA_START=141 /DNA_END=659 /DNA_ORIENTATION=+